MADFYKLLKADPLGEPWTPNVPGAKPIQNYWCQVEGQDKPVSIGKQVGNTLRPGQHIYGDLKYAKSQKGNEYWKFDSQMVPQDVQRPQDDPSTPAQASAQAAVGDNIPAWAVPLYNMVEYIYKEMKKMDTDAEVVSHTATTKGSEEQLPDVPKGVDQVGGEPVDEKTQANLDDIFGVPEGK